MNLRIRYDNEFQKVDVELTEMEGWLNIDVSEESTIEEREQVVQEKVNDVLNKPEYNSWRHLERYRDEREISDGNDYEENTRIGSTRIPGFEGIGERESVCNLVRSIFPKKPEWADAVIAVYIDGCSIREYARKTGENENNITQKLKRARNTMKKFFSKPSDFGGSSGY